MIPLGEARARVLRDCHLLPVVEVPLAAARGLVTALEVRTDEDVPPFANTAMDGFAVVAADTVGATDERPVRLDVVGTVAAGSSGEVQVRSGSAARIMTGAPIPPGADAVVMVERCRPSDDGSSVEVTVEVAPGNHVRPAGDDLRAGDPVVAAGVELTAGHLGVLAGIGRRTVEVHRRPRVGVMSTGDELVEGPGPLEPGQIRDANRHTLLALLDELGCESVDLGIVPDDEAAITAAIRDGVERCDALVTSGGVSMGDFDYVKVVLDRLGDMDWMQVAIKPAKPLAFGTVDGTPVFGLPGNPVSSMVSFELFARPGLRRMMGHEGPGRLIVDAVAVDGLARRPDGKTHFLRVQAAYGEDGRFHVRSAGGQGSHQLSAMAAASALAVLPDGDGVAPGGTVEAILLG
ncbi:molybdopterin molybdotransferase MoeA [Actinomarinicola tropica]|uniref:Molybdopterin molybdenumtransferase n=1 Tax=Actinomarinicola tropica TaxID=2789776 RepID=A0A5Q2RSB5_9ACTN|nr:gephyrin-like molybdotransferase Glp [Actinomarinicola tropica]QGG96095.1 molybdopterin molybdenumtransferase MoeA [Actinomarinicola tropica]